LMRPFFFRSRHRQYFPFSKTSTRQSDLKDSVTALSRLKMV
jgi:hypothetical protein